MKKFFTIFKTIFQISFLRNILFIWIILAISFLLFERFYSYPMFQKILIEFTETDAARMSEHLSRTLISHDQNQLLLPPNFHIELVETVEDFGLEKVKVFDGAGTIIFSTATADVGTLNTHPYFHEIVAQGHPYTKLVRKEDKTLEGRSVEKDVVESYHPIMINDRFLGAFELYYDISSKHQALKQIIHSQTTILELAAVLALISGLFILYQAAIIIRHRDQIRTELEDNEKRLRLGVNVIQHARQGIMITGADNIIEMVNPAFSQITGYDRTEAIGNKPSLLKSGRHDQAFYKDLWTTLQRDGHWDGEIWNRRKNGEIYPERLHISAIYDTQQQLSHYVAIFSDISLYKESEEQLERMAFFDPLTGIANRLLFRERLTQSLKELERVPDQKIGVLFLDLDHFKEVNDTYGHQTGDQLLQLVASRLTSIVRKEDTVSRLGGDEFGIILNHIPHTSVASLVAEKIIENLSQPLQINEASCQIGVSIGITFSPDQSNDPTELISQADFAMYQAKKGGRNRANIFTPPS